MKLIGMGSLSLFAVLVAAVAVPSSAICADDGGFPTADQVGGEVFPDGLQPGDTFPADVVLYDAEGNETTLGKLAQGKRTLLTFFITAAPASVAELKVIESTVKAAPELNVIFANSDLVGNALFGGAKTQLAETVRTVGIVKTEGGLTTPMYVAPNNVYAPDGLSNRLGFRGLPTSYLISADGKVERTFVGTREWTPADFEKVEE